MLCRQLLPIFFFDKKPAIEVKFVNDGQLALF